MPLSCDNHATPPLGLPSLIPRRSSLVARQAARCATNPPVCSTRGRPTCPALQRLSGPRSFCLTVGRLVLPPPRTPSFGSTFQPYAPIPGLLVSADWAARPNLFISTSLRPPVCHCRVLSGRASPCLALTCLDFPLVFVTYIHGAYCTSPSTGLTLCPLTVTFSAGRAVFPSNGLSTMRFLLS